MTGDGYISVRLPEGLVQKVDEYVEKKIFASRAQGVVAFITAGMVAFDPEGEAKRKVTEE